MKSKVAAFLLMCHLLISSAILPLSDFSLWNELPRMYRAYEKLTTSGERDVFDFLGDYLLGGKDLFGHNKHDLPDKNNAVQFQHVSSFVYFIHKFSFPVIYMNHREPSEHVSRYLPGKSTDYSSSLLRPPVV